MSSSNGAPPRSRSIAVVGGGFGGVGAAVMLKRAGYEDVTVFEKGERVGGVWNHNTYPGAACDVPSHLYEFSFAPNPWSRRYAPQAEIQAYVEGVARRFGVLDRVRTGTEVKSARWDEERGRWLLETSAGPHEAEILLTACGQLSVPKMPAIPGLESFDGPAFHTAEWRHDVDLAGKRVAVVGTGCSAIQVVPAIQPEVDQSGRLPALARLDPAEDGLRVLRARRTRCSSASRRCAASTAPAIFGLHGVRRRGDDAPAVAAAARCVPLGRRQITAAIEDPELRRKVMPSDEFGCKRMMLTDEWYPTLTQPNVELVTERIAEVTPGGVRDAAGVERPADVLVLRHRLRQPRLRRADGDRRPRRPHV